MGRWNAAADEQRFREDVKVGDVWVRRIAARFEHYGLWSVAVPDVQVRATYDQRRDFRDDGDLFLNGHRIEVRSFGFRFSSQADFPRSTVQVELASVIHHKRNAVAYVFVSRPTGAAVGLVGCDLKRLDRLDDVWNDRRGVARDWMIAPSTALINWAALINTLSERCT